MFRHAPRHTQFKYPAFSTYYLDDSAENVNGIVYKSSLSSAILKINLWEIQQK